MTSVNSLETYLPHIKALDALVSLGICSKSEDLLEAGDAEYRFKIEVDNYFTLPELERLQKQFLADELKMSYYYDSDEEKDILAVDLYFKLARDIGDTS